MINNQITYNSEIVVKYIISVEDEEAYSKECQIHLIFKTCYNSCEICSEDYSKSNMEQHNCLKCKENYYLSPENNNNCFKEEEKKLNWFFDSIGLKFELCDENCVSCLGENNCITCKDGYHLDSGICTNECSEGYFPMTVNYSPYSICTECFGNCQTCSKKGNYNNMNCDICKENHIKYNNNYFEIFNSTIKSFYEYINNETNISSCKQKFALYIKENSYECINLPDEDEGYYISNNETGLLSKCHNNCLSCKSGPIYTDSGYIETMECIKCKDSDSSEKSMIKLNNNCIKIIDYNESSIILDVSELTNNQSIQTFDLRQCNGICEECNLFTTLDGDCPLKLSNGTIENYLDDSTIYIDICISQIKEQEIILSDF